jgi:serine protease Do
MTFGAPVYALRAFLMRGTLGVLSKAPDPGGAPWLGLGGASSVAGGVKGVRVVGVAPGSPAEKAGLKSGEAPDTIVAVDGIPVESPEQLAEVIGKRAIDQQVKLLVFGGAKFREVPVTLKAASSTP